MPTDKKFTGQRLDGTGLYYYGARYYDPGIGRFISPDTVVHTEPLPLGQTIAALTVSYAQPQRLADLGKLGGRSSNPLANRADAVPHLLNRYSYVGNNPARYVDPTGEFIDWVFDAISIAFDLTQLVNHPSWENAAYLVADVVLAIIPIVPAGVGPTANAGKPLFKTGEGAVKQGQTVERVAVKASEGFGFFRALKEAIGSAGEGKVWHHIVEQGQIGKSGFDRRLVNNPKNVVAVDEATNSAINAYYSSKRDFTQGKTVRDWLSGKSFEEQYDFGMQVLRDLGVLE